MSDRKWRTWEVLGLIFVLAAGNLLHFVYDWSGQSPVVGALASVNESTWEHMKLLTTPWVLWSIVELIALRRTGLPVLTARAAGLLAGLAAIPLLFYGYQGGSGPGHHVAGRGHFPDSRAAGLLGDLGHAAPPGAGVPGVASGRGGGAGGGMGGVYPMDLRPAGPAAVCGPGDGPAWDPIGFFSPAPAHRVGPEVGGN